MIISNGCVCFFFAAFAFCFHVNYKFLHSTETNYPHFSFQNRGVDGLHTAHKHIHTQPTMPAPWQLFRLFPSSTSNSPKTCCVHHGKKTINFVHLSFACVNFQDDTNQQTATKKIIKTAITKWRRQFDCYDGNKFIN